MRATIKGLFVGAAAAGLASVGASAVGVGTAAAQERGQGGTALLTGAASPSPKLGREAIGHGEAFGSRRLA